MKNLTPDERKNAPVARGVLDYFPDAIMAVADLSRIGNEQHNPGQPMHWAKERSTDHADCIVRHLIERGTIDSDGVRHAAKVAWRALALLQTELDAVSHDTKPAFEDTPYKPCETAQSIAAKNYAARIKPLPRLTIDETA